MPWQQHYAASVAIPGSSYYAIP